MERRIVLGVVVSAIAIYWFAVQVLGTPLARDSVDIASIVMGAILAASLIPLAVDYFKNGGDGNGWKLLLGNVTYLLGWVFFCGWTFLTRSEGRPDWMVESPVNGFFKFWILSGIVLSYFGTNDPLPTVPQHRIYFLFWGVGCGVLIGIALASFLGI